MFSDDYESWAQIYFSIFQMATANCTKQFLSCHHFTNQMSAPSPDLMSDQQRPKQITVANAHHSEHLLVSLQWMVCLEQSMPLVLKIQVTWSFWKKKNYIRWCIWEWWFAYPHFKENSACSLFFFSHATIECCHMWPYYPLEKKCRLCTKIPVL